jgi:hypothetical protein
MSSFLVLCDKCPCLNVCDHSGDYCRLGFEVERRNISITGEKFRTIHTVSNQCGLVEINSGVLTIVPKRISREDWHE